MLALEDNGVTAAVVARTVRTVLRGADLNALTLKKVRSLVTAELGDAACSAATDFKAWVQSAVDAHIALAAAAIKDGAAPEPADENAPPAEAETTPERKRKRASAAKPAKKASPAPPPLPQGNDDDDRVSPSESEGEGEGEKAPAPKKKSPPRAPAKSKAPPAVAAPDETTFKRLMAAARALGCPPPPAKFKGLAADPAAKSAVVRAHLAAKGVPGDALALSKGDIAAFRAKIDLARDLDGIVPVAADEAGARPGKRRAAAVAAAQFAQQLTPPKLEEEDDEEGAEGGEKADEAEAADAESSSDDDDAAGEDEDSDSDYHESNDEDDE